MKIDNRYLIQPIENLEFIANDGSDFSKDFFEEVNSSMKPLSMLNVDSRCVVNPDNYQEDYVQAYRRSVFTLSDWRVIGVFVDDEGKPIQTVCVLKSNQSEGFIYNLVSNCLVVLFYRGFNIKESADSQIIEGELFLDSIGIAEETITDYYLSYDEEIDFDDGRIIEIQNNLKQDFVPNSKRKILNLGNSIIIDEDIVNNDSDEEILIEVERPKFSGNKKNKIPNLGYSRIKRQPQPIYKPHVDSTRIEYPIFEATSSKGVKNLGYSTNSNKKPKIVIKKPIQTEKPIEIKLPSFVPNSQTKIVNFDEVIAKENRNWSIIDIYKVKPNVFKGERSIINSKDFIKEISKFKEAENKFKNVRKLDISNDCVFVPNRLNEDNKVFKSLSNFDINKFKSLILVLKDEEILKSVLYDGEATIVVRFDSHPIVEVISLTGVSLDDRAMPYYSFENILSMVK